MNWAGGHHYFISNIFYGHLHGSESEQTDALHQVCLTNQKEHLLRSMYMKAGMQTYL